MKFGINNPAWLQAAGNRVSEATFYVVSRADNNEIGFFDTLFADFANNLTFSVNSMDNWQQLERSTIISINSGDVVYFRNNTGESSRVDGRKLFNINKEFDAGGELTRMLFPDGVLVEYALNYAFGELPIVSAKNLSLHIDTLGLYCYSDMFLNCSSLTEAPALPATTLSDQCYERMFKGCSSLTEAPALPVTTLYYRCYGEMFSGCSSLTEAPALPATTLADSCYERMFKGCSSLTEAPALPATTLAESCYSGMFQQCSSLTEAPALPATTLAESCYNGMFSECEALTVSPILPATTLVYSCYRSMFSTCQYLETVICLATDISAYRCTEEWLNRVPATGTFTKAAGVEWPTGISGIPEGWTVQDYAG